MRTAIFGILFCFFIADGSQGNRDFEFFFEPHGIIHLVNKRGTLVSSLLHREYARLVRF